MNNSAQLKKIAIVGSGDRKIWRALLKAREKTNGEEEVLISLSDVICADEEMAKRLILEFKKYSEEIPELDIESLRKNKRPFRGRKKKNELFRKGSGSTPGRGRM